jgi:hypothetical protein
MSCQPADSAMIDSFGAPGLTGWEIAKPGSGYHGGSPVAADGRSGRDCHGQSQGGDAARAG